MKQAFLEITDEVNCRFRGLDAPTRKKLVDKLKFFNHAAKHTPAYKLGRWDGNVPFATIGGATYINLLDRVLGIVAEDGYEIEIVDKRTPRSFDFGEVCEDMLAHKCWPHGHPMAGEPIMLRDYQVAAINRYLAQPQSIQSISTGAGKTLLTAALSTICEPHGRTLVIVPSKSLVEQTEEDYRNLGLDVGVFYGDRKELGHRHTISTWQSLGSLMKTDRRGDAPLFTSADRATMQDIVRDLVCVMVDEVHSAKAKVLQDLLTGPLANVPIRLGLTGTVPKAEHEFVSLLASLGPVIGEIKASDLQDQGVLASCHVDILQLRDDVSYKSYPEEYDFLTSDPIRLGFIAATCNVLAESGNTLILVDRIDTGKHLQKLIPNSVFVSGSTKSKDRKKEYKDVQFADGKIIIATYGVAAVGINIPRIFNLVLIEAGKSFVRVIQSIGRGLRKSSDKDSVNIIDLCSTAKFSARHLTERKKYYAEAEYKHSVTKVDYR